MSGLELLLAFAAPKTVRTFGFEASTKQAAAVPFVLAIDWTTAAALGLIAVACAPIVVLLTIVFRILVALVLDGIRPRKPPRTVQTAIGQFVEESGYWRSTVVVEEREIAVTAIDTDGVPDPEFLNRLPRILSEIRSLEVVARKRAYEISPQHQLDEIADDRSAEFALGFSDEGDPIRETVYVCFARGSVTEINFVD